MIPTIASRRLLLSACAIFALFPATGHGADAWPPVTRETRPWGYWWWMASAVDKTNITRELQRYRDAGMGGVHIIPIYGAKGFEEQYIPYLSDRWFEILRHTVTEAERLDLGVDMTTGSGWCFGGPNVRDHEANALVQVKTFDVAAGEKLTQRFDAPATHALIGYSASGAVDLTSKIAADGTVDWTAPAPHKLYVVTQRPSGQKVKRAAPGGEGHMLNLLYRDGVAHWIERFTKAFADYNGPKPRAMYHDSYEYRSDWAPDFLAQFEKRRGYRLQEYLPQLISREQNDLVARIKCDYRETASDILCEETIPLWVRWSHDRGFLTRNQAHGSPANLLDLYAAVDTPETEMFNRDRNKLISKIASSAAHVAGRKRVSAETGTWLKEHFTERLSDLKYLADDLFLSGVNHIFYHGTIYSPDEAPWPGWLFYASTEMNPRNPIWRDAPALNAYVARCQAILQSGRSDNDLLVYWPIHDFWREASGMLPHLTVHSRGWFEQQPIGHAAEHLWNRGFTFDYISDRQLAATRLEKGRLTTAGGEYKAILVPKCETMPIETFKRLLSLAESGATILFEEKLPGDVPGLGKLDVNREELKRLSGNLKFESRDHGKQAALGRGKVLVGALDAITRNADIAREPLVDQHGLWFIRRAIPGGQYYFLANRGTNAVSGWIQLAAPLASATLLDPLTARAGTARVKPTSRELLLQLQPGESIVIQTQTKRVTGGPEWDYREPSGQPIELGGQWRVEFVAGGPTLPQTTNTSRLTSWTEFGDPESQRFAGTARYTLRFNAPDSLGADAFIDLGSVEQSARVRLNGEDLGTLITPPYRVLAKTLRPGENMLEVEVTSVAANRIRDLDRRGVKWRNFHDINFVNMDYKPFDASNWPLHPSGLLGPVTLRQAGIIRTP